MTQSSQTSKKTTNPLVLAIAVMGLSVGVVVPAVAQSPAPPSTAETAPVEITDTKLESVVDVLIEVEEVRSEYTPKIEAASDEQQHAELVNEANEMIIAKIEAQPDLTTDEYLGVLAQAQQDPDLGLRITQLVDQRVE